MFGHSNLGSSVPTCNDPIRAAVEQSHANFQHQQCQIKSVVSTYLQKISKFVLFKAVQAYCFLLEGTFIIIFGVLFLISLKGQSRS